MTGYVSFSCTPDPAMSCDKNESPQGLPVADVVIYSALWFIGRTFPKAFSVDYHVTGDASQSTISTGPNVH